MAYQLTTRSPSELLGWLRKTDLETPEVGGYDEHRPWEGLLAELVIRSGRVERIDFMPLDLDEGNTYRSDYDDLEFLSRRGLAELATGPLADSILLRLRELSARYGTELTIARSRATLEIASGY